MHPLRRILALRTGEGAAVTYHPIPIDTPRSWCTVCGAVVADSAAHDRWHAEGGK